MALEDEFKELKQDFKELSKQYVNMKITLGIAIGIGGILGIGGIFGINSFLKAKSTLNNFEERVIQLEGELDSATQNVSEFVESELNSIVDTKKSELSQHTTSLLREINISKLVREEIGWKKVSSTDDINPRCEYRWYVSDGNKYESTGDYIYATKVSSEYISTAFKTSLVDGPSARGMSNSSIGILKGQGSEVKVELYRRCIN